MATLCRQDDFTVVELDRSYDALDEQPIEALTDLLLREIEARQPINLVLDFSNTEYTRRLQRPAGRRRVAVGAQRPQVAAGDRHGLLPGRLTRRPFGRERLLAGRTAGSRSRAVRERTARVTARRQRADGASS